MDPTKAGNTELLDELLGFESRELEEEDKTVVLDRQDSPDIDLDLASYTEDPDGDRPTSVPPAVAATFARVLHHETLHELEPEALEPDLEGDTVEENGAEHAAAEELEPEAVHEELDGDAEELSLEALQAEVQLPVGFQAAREFDDLERLRDREFDAQDAETQLAPAVAAVAAGAARGSTPSLAMHHAGPPSGALRASAPSGSMRVSPPSGSMRVSAPVASAPLAPAFGGLELAPAAATVPASAMPSSPPPKPVRAIEPSSSGALSISQPLSRNDLEDAWVGELIDGRYRVLRLLGVGGIGLVYLCRHEPLEKPVALKVLRPEYVAHEDLNERFMNEARAASSIKSPRIVDTLDVGVLPNGAPYFVMEYVEGETLASLLDREGNLGLVRSVDFARQMAEGLDAAHAAGVVHRDLKPENVFLAQQADGLYVKIFDFGIAKVASARKRLTYVGAVFGTPHYMSPEQARGEPVDARSDLYALGVMLFEMIAGNVPFDGEEPLAVMSQHVDRPPPLMSTIAQRPVPAALESIVGRCLAKDPRDRYSSAAELLYDLNLISEVDLRSAELTQLRRTPVELSPPAPAAALASSSPLASPARSQATRNHVTPSHIGRGHVAGSQLEYGGQSLGSNLGVERPETLHAHVVSSTAPRGRKRGRVLWLLLTLLALGGTGVFAFRQFSQKSALRNGLSQQASTSRVQVPVTKSELVSTGDQDPGEGVKVDFVLSPIDSHVFLGEEDLGPMPVSIRVEKDKPLALTVRRQGYVTRRVVVDGSETRVVIGLMSVEKANKRRPQKPAR